MYFGARSSIGFPVPYNALEIEQRDFYTLVIGFRFRNGSAIVMSFSRWTLGR